MIQTRIEPRTYSLASYSYTTEPAGHSVALLQSTNISRSMLEYIYSAHAPCVIARDWPAPYDLVLR